MPTVFGDKTISIPPLTKHKDTVIIPKVGVNKNNQIINVFIDYPDNTDDLIKTLEGK